MEPSRHGEANRNGERRRAATSSSLQRQAREAKENLALDGSVFALWALTKIG